MITVKALLTTCVVIIAVLLYALLERDVLFAKVSYDCIDPTERERVRELALAGIDDGLKRSMTHLFEVWQKDPEHEQPKRAQVGTTNAINAHNRARKLALAWDPPTCTSQQEKTK
jgi:hypothetical protein